METNSHTPDFFSFRRKRLPVILQAEATECGLACIAMVAGFHGHECDLGELRQRFQLSLKGLTLSGLIDIAERLRLSARPLRVELAHLEQLVTPCILHWNFNHFVVLSEIRGNKAVIHDPAVGRRVLKLSDVSGSFTGIALELTPNMQFESKPKPASVPVRKLVGSVQGLKSTALHIFLLAVVLELFTLLSPLFVQFVMDDVLADADWNFLTTLGIAFSIFALLQGAIMGARGLALINLGATLNWAWT